MVGASGCQMPTSGNSCGSATSKSTPFSAGTYACVHESMNINAKEHVLGRARDHRSAPSQDKDQPRTHRP